MGSGKKAPQVKLSERQREILEKYRNRRNISRQHYHRVGIILQAFKGRQNLQISESLSLHFNTVSKWRNRWVKSYDHLCEYERGVSGEGVSDSELLQKMLDILTDEARSGPPLRISLTEKQQLIALACKNRIAEATRRFWCSHHPMEPRDVGKGSYGRGYRRKNIPTLCE